MQDLVQNHIHLVEEDSHPVAEEEVPSEEAGEVPVRRNLRILDELRWQMLRRSKCENAMKMEFRQTLKHMVCIYHVNKD